MAKSVLNQIAYALEKAKKKRVNPADCILCRPAAVPKHIEAGREKLTAINTIDGKMVVMGPLPKEKD